MPPHRAGSSRRRWADVHIAIDTLWSREGKRAWNYLATERGLTEETIVDAGFGYIPGGHREWKAIAGLNVP